MRPRLRKLLVGVSALAALALGGSAISQAGTPAQKSPEPATVQEQSAPSAATGPNNVQGDTTTDNASERGEQSEKADGSEKAESETAETEVPNDDGPGGHADEPANPNANHEAQGSE